jgi:hypothetical protein
VTATFEIACAAQLTHNWNSEADSMRSQGEKFLGCNKLEFGFQGCPSTKKIAHFLTDKWIPPRKPVTEAEEVESHEDDWTYTGHFFNPSDLLRPARIHSKHGRTEVLPIASTILSGDTPKHPALNFLPVLADFVAYIKTRPWCAVPAQVRSKGT